MLKINENAYGVLVMSQDGADTRVVYVREDLDAAQKLAATLIRSECDRLNPYYRRKIRDLLRLPSKRGRLLAAWRRAVAKIEWVRRIEVIKVF